METIKGINTTKLFAAIKWSEKQLEKPREERVLSLREYVGKHYNTDGSSFVVPINFLELAVTIYSRLLAARNPRVKFTTDNRNLRPFAKDTEIALNQIPDEIKLGKILERSVIEALFRFAVAKVGLKLTDSTENGPPGTEPYVEMVSIDDYFCDMSAKSYKSIQYEGNTYWMELETAKELFKDNDLNADEHTVSGLEGEERADGISSDEGGDVYKDQIQLRDVWLPGTRQLLTYAVNEDKILRVVNWDGPEEGPYEMLGFSYVPGNVLPLPPTALWYDLHDLANKLFRKLSKQAISKKRIIAFSGNGDEGPNQIKNASDGEGIKYSGQKPENIDVGGIDQVTLAFLLQVADRFNYFAGNLDSLGGLAPSTDTVGQDKLLSEAASARLQGMREKTLDFAQAIFKRLAWYEWTDPIRVRKIHKGIPGTDIGVDLDWSADTREGDFLDYNFNIDVYSMQEDSPSTKLQKIGLVLERFIFPMLPMIQQQGGQIDIQSLIKMISEYSNLPEFADLVKFVSGIQQPPAVEGNQVPAMANNTTRTYERVNRPGATRHGKDDVMTRLLMGSGVQGSEAASLTRSTA